MVELTGDPCEPSFFVLPTNEFKISEGEGREGEMFISNGKIVFYTGTAVEVVTSAAM